MIMVASFVPWTVAAVGVVTLSVSGTAGDIPVLQAFSPIAVNVAAEKPIYPDDEPEDSKENEKQDRNNEKNHKGKKGKGK